MLKELALRAWFTGGFYYLLASVVDSGFSGVNNALDGVAVGGFLALHGLMAVVGPRLLRR